ncbi:MAG: hypothetical protein COA94_08055 [Rickettsiales bacterium]|nr:MAG: hypothetical protein COA94_08055 [Rickettsiales bacterium]
MKRAILFFIIFAVGFAVGKARAFPVYHGYTDDPLTQKEYCEIYYPKSTVAKSEKDFLEKYFIDYSNIPASPLYLQDMTIAFELPCFPEKTSDDLLQERIKLYEKGETW